MHTHTHIQIAKLARDLAMGNKGPSIPPPRAAAVAPSKPAGAQTSAPPKSIKMTGKEVAGMRAELFGEPTSKKATSKQPEVTRPPPPPSQPSSHSAAQPHDSKEEEEVKSKPIITGGESSTPEVEVPVEGGAVMEGGGGTVEGEDNEFGGMLT